MEASKKKIAFIGSECYPFVKTGGLGDVMYALPKALIQQNCEVRVILPSYSVIPAKFRKQMRFCGSFLMNLYADGTSFPVILLELEQEGVTYNFIENPTFFSWGNPYSTLWDDIPKFCYFAKASLAALNYLDWVPDVIHCHDWQAALVPVYAKTLFAPTPVGSAKTMLTIHNLRFQGVYSIDTFKYWTGLPDECFNYDKLGERDCGNMMKGGLAYADSITTVSETYAEEIQTAFYGDGLDGHLRYHRKKLSGIVNGIDVDIWNSSTDKLLPAPYGDGDVLEKKRENKLALQREMGLEENPDKLLLGLISRLTDQKGLDLVSAVFPDVLDGKTQFIVLGTGDPAYEEMFRQAERQHKGEVCAYISYNEGLAHKIYAAADALLVPSLFEPCGLTQLIAMRYGTIPIVRETGGLKDTVIPYAPYSGNGFTFDLYEAPLLLKAIDEAKSLYFNDRDGWNGMISRDMAKDVSWANSAKQYIALYEAMNG